MITLEELREKARIKSLGLGNAEKDYLLTLALFSISKRTRNELVFKGGTALYKFYGLGRFSEDIDFSAVKPIDHTSLSRGIALDMGAFGIGCEVKSVKEVYNSVLMKFRCKGPLYKGTPITISSVRVDINLKSSVELEPENKHCLPPYAEIPGFSILVMQESEMLAEKIRAAMARSKARDFYDIWFLVQKGIRPGKGLLKKKFDYYGFEWDPGAFEKRIAALEGLWEKELARLIARPPDFSEAKKLVASESRKWEV